MGLDNDANTDEAPAGFRPAGLTGHFLEEGGPYFAKNEGNRLIIGLRVGPRHTNYLDIAHGGVISTLADIALSFPVYLSEQPHPVVTTSSLTVNFLYGAKMGDWLEASATIDRMGKRTAHTHGSIICGDRVLATASGVFSIFRPVQA